MPLAPFARACLALSLLLVACSTGDDAARTTPTSGAAAQRATAPPTAQPTAAQSAVPATAGATVTTPPTREPTADETRAPSVAATGQPTWQPRPTEASATPAPTDSAPTTGQDAELDRIARDTAGYRELAIKRDIREDYLSRQQLRDRLRADFDEEYPAAEAVADERVLEAFGLIPEGADLRKLYLDLYGEQIAGFYDPEEDEMFLISDDRELSALEETTYAHEVVHALQDQYYDLEKVREPFEDVNDDSLLAVTALIEGDAELTRALYVRDKPGLAAQIAEAREELGQNQQAFDRAPPIISRSLNYPYEDGAVFNVYLWQNAGWRAVDRAYADPPTSTEQILHPEKYLDERDEPTEITLPDLAPALGAGWKRLEVNLFGEFQTRVLLQGQGESEGDAVEAAKGWDGDRFAVYANGDREATVWETVWDSEDDAAEFAEALRAYDEARFGTPYDELDDRLQLAADGQVALIQEDGDRVRWVLAPDEQLAQVALSSLGAD